ncbi:MAG: sugar phosphate isomerase/epimerase [Acidimicrobiales bacterium]|jgi:hexulose-6-phosphate isomerase|nr:sugar phosphate isomerase/epimerase [Acidimicrobiales bacterium]
MQGRLSSPVDGQIQAFPQDRWREEFVLADEADLRIMEWTIDHERIFDNPLMTVTGRNEIRQLSEQHGVLIPSLTGDCFMQAPFWKASGEQRYRLEGVVRSVLNACRAAGIGTVVVPLVDEGSPTDEAEEELLALFLLGQAEDLNQSELRMAFESDLPPSDLAAFIERFPPGLFGINYDIGNSASMGFDPVEEFAAYGDRILNVHVKDRSLGGTTVALGEGDAEFETVFAALSDLGYSGNFILQTARDPAGDHLSSLVRFRDMTIDWMMQYGL